MKKLLPFFFLLAAATAGAAPQTIQVETRNLALVLSAEPGGKVVFQYFGDRFAGIDALAGRGFRGQPDTRQDFGPQLYPAYGGRYYLTPALKLTNADGVLTTELVFKGMRAERLDDDRTRTVVSLADPLYSLEVEVTFTAYEREDIIAQAVSVIHSQPGEVLLESVASCYLPLHAADYYLTHFHGTWAAEMQMEQERLTHGVKVVESKKGVRTTQSENPSFLLSTGAPLAEGSGEVYAGSLAWSGNYRLSFELDETGMLNVLGGINPFAALYRLRPGEKFTTPEMLLTYSSAGCGQVSRNFHDWARRYGMTHGDRLRPIILNSWEGAYFTFDEKTLTDMMDRAAEFGVEMFVLDDGWFGNKYPRNADNAGLGDWQVNKKKLPRGIGYLADYAVSKGMKFGIWIEPEMVNPKSELAERHPDWIVRSGGREVLPMRNQWLLDLSNPEVQDFVFRTFDEVVSLSKNIAYIKWDANRHVDNVGSSYLSADRQTHFWYDYVEGLYKVYERIRAKYPDIEIQLCSSGGGRLDYGALRFHDEVWTSDNTNALDRIFIQWGTNMFFPAIVTGAHVSTTPNHQTGMMSPLKYRFDVAMSGRLGMELQPKDIPAGEYPQAKAAIVDYKRIRPIVQLGDLYRLVSPYGDSGWASLLYASKDRSQAVVFAYSLRYHPRTTWFETKLSGLDPEKTYRVTELNVKPGHKAFSADGQSFTGDYLMHAGLSLNINGPYDSVVLLLEAQ